MANKHPTLISLFSDIADAIRSKTGSTDTIIADDFPEAIAAIETQSAYETCNVTIKVSGAISEAYLYYRQIINGSPVLVCEIIETSTKSKTITVIKGERVHFNHYANMIMSYNTSSGIEEEGTVQYITVLETASGAETLNIVYD